MPFISQISSIEKSPFILPAMAILIIAALVWTIVLANRLRKIRKQNEIIFSGKKVENLEDLLLDQSKTIHILDKDIQELYNISNQINSLAARSIHRIGIVRFNPFKDVGGDQSFALALLNGKNNGLTISSLYTREGARIFAKNIINGETEKHPLTKEEKEAIKIATESKNTK